MLKHFALIGIFFMGLTTITFGQAKSELVGKRTAVIISKIDESVVNEFQKAWLLSGHGFAQTEAVVLLHRQRDGSISARSIGSSRVSRQFTFAWNASIVAVVHTHPNGADPKPAGQDLQLADRFRIPIFTITQLGMYVYDPDTRKTSIVHAGLDWLKLTKWNHDGPAVAQA